MRKLLNVTVGCASCVAAGFVGTVPRRRAGVSLVESSLLFQFSESDLVLFAAAVSDVPTWNAGVLQLVRFAKTAALTGGGLSV